MAKNIYVDLISNASVREFNYNTPSKFTNRLAAPLNLQGDWEVGLLEVVHPKVKAKLYHNGRAWLHGNVPSTYEQKFKIDFTHKNPFDEVEKVAKNIKKNITANIKPDFHKDENGIYSITVGSQEIPDQWEVVSHMYIKKEALPYFGMADDLFKEDLKGKKYKKESEALFHDRTSPRKTLSKTTHLFDLWAAGIPTTQLKIDVNPTDTIQIVAENLNKLLKNVFEKPKWKELPSPQFSIGTDGRLVYKPGLKMTKKTTRAMIRFDEETLKYLGFDSVNWDGFEPSTALLRPLVRTSSIAYFYTDIVQEHNVGDVSANSLRALPLGDTIHTAFNPVVYYPAKIKQIDIVNLLVSDELGTQVEFEPGVLHATLHFRKKLY